MAFRDNFERFGKKVSDTANNLADKTKTSAETVSLTTKVNAEENKIKTAYTEIGRKYVEAHPADYEDIFQAEIEAINASQAKIAEYKEQIRENKGRMFCGTCGAEIAKTEEKCPYCGADNPVGIKLAQEKAEKESEEAAKRAEREAQRQAEREARQEAQRVAREAAQEKVAQRRTTLGFCPKCGAQRVAGADFCVKCGYSFGTAQASAPVEKPAEPTPATPVAEKPAEPTPATPVAEKPVESTPATSTSTESAPRICAKCGKEVPDGFVFCPECGNKMD